MRLATKPAKSNGHRRHQNHDQRDDRIQHSHHHKRAQNGSHSRQKLCQALQKPLGYKIRIVDHSADDVAVRVAVDVLQRRAVSTRNASPRISLDALLEILRVQTFITHWLAAASSTEIPSSAR